MELLDQFFDIQSRVHEYFGYAENYRVFPLDDAREYFWRFDGQFVIFARTETDLDSDGDYYENELYTQRHLSKWVYETDDYTMIVVDTHTDGNKFLQVFANEKRRDTAEVTMKN